MQLRSGPGSPPGAPVPSASPHTSRALCFWGHLWLWQPTQPPSQLVHARRQALALGQMLMLVLALALALVLGQVPGTGAVLVEGPRPLVDGQWRLGTWAPQARLGSLRRWNGVLRVLVVVAAVAAVVLPIGMVQRGPTAQGPEGREGQGRVWRDLQG
jgi:hypothetical protein